MSCDKIGIELLLGKKNMILTGRGKKIGKKEKMMEKFSEMKYVRPDGGSVYSDHPERNKEL